MTKLWASITCLFLLDILFVVGFVWLYVRDTAIREHVVEV